MHFIFPLVLWVDAERLPSSLIVLFLIVKLCSLLTE